MQLDSWSVGALAYDVLCGRAPFAAHEDIPRDEETKAILHEVGGTTAWQSISLQCSAAAERFSPAQKCALLRHARASAVRLQPHCCIRQMTVVCIRPARLARIEIVLVTGT